MKDGFINGGGQHGFMPAAQHDQQIDATEEAATQLRAEAIASDSPQSVYQRRMIDRIEGSPRHEMQAEAVQRMEDDEVQTKAIQRMEDDEVQTKAIQRMEDDEVQTKAIQRMEADGVGQSKIDLGQGPAQLEDTPAQRAEAGESVSDSNGMPGQLLAGIKSLSGMDVSDVQVHKNSAKPAQLNALAYAQGSDIHVAPGQDQHLPHEAWHVVQQRQGRVAPTTEVEGQKINDNPGLESEADVMGSKAMSEGSKFI